MKRVTSLLLAVCCSGAASAVDPPHGAPDDLPTVDLPFTIEKVWYRGGGKRLQGDLTVTSDGIELITRKKAIPIPLDRIQFISYGTRKWDVDTEWAVLSVGVARPWQLVGIRDGKKWGYGGRTRQIYRQLRETLKQLGAAQYLVASGYQAYEDPNHGCSFAIPGSWSAYLESLVVAGGGSPGSTTILSERPIHTVERGSRGKKRPVDDFELLDAVLAGESPGFFLERSEIHRGMTCRGFSPSNRQRVLARAERDPVFGNDYEVLEPLVLSEATVGGCEGLHVKGRTRRPDGAEVVLEIYAAASGGTLYFFGLRALADRHEAHREPFAAALETVKFSAHAVR